MFKKLKFIYVNVITLLRALTNNMASSVDNSRDLLIKLVENGNLIDRNIHKKLLDSSKHCILSEKIELLQTIIQKSNRIDNPLLVK